MAGPHCAVASHVGRKEPGGIKGRRVQRACDQGKRAGEVQVDSLVAGGTLADQHVSAPLSSPMRRNRYS
jgi:hypothetical protein